MKSDYRRRQADYSFFRSRLRKIPLQRHSSDLGSVLIKGFSRKDEGVVDRPARSAEVQRDAVLVGPAVKSVRDEPWAVVDPDPLWPRPRRKHGIENGRHLLAGDTLVNLNRQGLAGEYIEQREGPEPRAVKQCIRHEVHRLDLVLCRRGHALRPVC